MSPIAQHAAFHRLRASIHAVEHLRGALQEFERGGAWIATLAIVRLKDALNSNPDQ